jgi:cytochrome c biogenesis protein CcmG/thiol:disulfide interchange protein DsbE
VTRWDRGLLTGAGLLLLGLVAAACASNGGTVAEQPRGSPGASAPGESFTVVAYQGEDQLGGDEVEFDSLLGQGKPVVLNFWAAQCPPCRAEMPWFQQAHERHGDSVLLVGVDIGPFIGLGSNEQGKRLLEELEIGYPAAAAVDDKPIRRFRVIGMPTTVFFDAGGSVIRTHAGILTKQQIDEWFERLTAGTE